MALILISSLIGSAQAQTFLAYEEALLAASQKTKTSTVQSLSQWQMPAAGSILQKNFNSRSEGVGFLVGRDKNIKAVNSGKVLRVVENNKWNRGRGNYIVINHTNGFQSIYESLTDIVVEEGDLVAAGDLLGLAELTQEYEGAPVAFFQLTKNDQLIDPWEYLPESEWKSREVILGWQFNSEKPKVEDEVYMIKPTEGLLTQGVGRWHVAVDIANKVGTEVLAARSGVVTEVANNGSWNYGYGNYLIIDHGDGVETLYAHNSNVYVSLGETITQGQVISAMGSTGQSSGPHLHFEVRVNGIKKNPWNYLP